MFLSLSHAWKADIPLSCPNRGRLRCHETARGRSRDNQSRQEKRPGTVVALAGFQTRPQAEPLVVRLTKFGPCPHARSPMPVGIQNARHRTELGRYEVKALFGEPCDLHFDVQNPGGSP